MKNPINDLGLIDFLACPECKGDISEIDGLIVCQVCKAQYLIQDGIPVFLSKIGQNNHNNVDTFASKMNYIEHYSRDAIHFDYFEERECRATQHDEKRLREYIVSLVPKDATAILDAGSGGGWLAKYLNNNKKLVSIDISLKNLAKIKEEHSSTQIKRETDSIVFAVCGDALRPPFKNESFDCIITSEVIEHIVEPKIFAESLFQLLKPGGVLIISTPYKEKIPLYLCIHCNQLTPKNAHLHSFDEQKLSDLIKDHNLARSQTFIFGNKAAHLLRFYAFLQFFPFPVWRIFDKLMNIIIKKPEHIIIKYYKHCSPY